MLYAHMINAVAARRYTFVTKLSNESDQIDPSLRTQTRQVLKFAFVGGRGQTCSGKTFSI